MMETEFVRSMHANYERIRLEEQPEDKKYQYCILSRGGVKGLLDCSLRYMDGQAYLYYDISSRQSVSQLYQKKNIKRKWVKDFLWSMEMIQKELDRYLLDSNDILWFPEQIFQDLEENSFAFLYIPYYQDDSGFLSLLEYLVEHIDYEDELLVECVYKMYEQCEKMGEVYLQEQIFEDAKILERQEKTGGERVIQPLEHIVEKRLEKATEGNLQDAGQEILDRPGKKEAIGQPKALKRGILSLWDSKKKKERDELEDYRQNMLAKMDGYAVAEDSPYELEEYGKTIYMEETSSGEAKNYRLYAKDGRIVMQLGEEPCTIGKKKGEVDLVLEDFSVSRIHARIFMEEGERYLEDLNSTNGTYKNELRLQPYEKRKLEEADEIRIGKTVLIYR